VLVTGAGSGIGRTAAHLFRRRGAELVLVGRRAAALGETLAAGPGVAHAVLDHADDAAVARFAAACAPLDGLFLNAGQFLPGTIEASPLATFEAMIAANLRGPWLLCHHLGPKLRAGASVVITGSNIGIRAITGAAAYSVAKAGAHMLARVLASEWAARGIRVNAIAPGPVHTEMLDERIQRHSDPAAELARLSGVNPLRRLGREEEVAGLAAYLLSDEAAWMTGTVIPCDGGATGAFVEASR
jgi:NAD(P)-dependent dehydrogenase (short-subunit alcohol dehydrogenase family)